MDCGGTMLIPHFFLWDYGCCKEYCEKEDDVFVCAWNRKEGMSKQREWRYYVFSFFLVFPFSNQMNYVMFDVKYYSSMFGLSFLFFHFPFEKCLLEEITIGW
jgi:hypothetical protein